MIRNLAGFYKEQDRAILFGTGLEPDLDGMTDLSTGCLFVGLAYVR